MEGRRWIRVQSIFDAASELPTEARGEFLETTCGDDAGLRAEVEGLLATLGLPTDPIGESVRHTLHATFQLPTGLEAGTLVGPYRLIRKIGEGGMASVYLASRADQQFERQVAIKFTRQGAATPHLSQRFRVERQILANLEHPNIARMLDGSLTDSGVPYLVMEYVDGVPIDEYCRQQKLAVRQVVDLFRAVCAAVEYAHRHLVVHRDVKPSNILVTQDGTPKLLDFGIAKLLSDTADTQAVTRPTQRFMTMEYASPEQVLGEPVTTATDVYSLGLVLYELMTSSRPFQAAKLGPLELQEKICRSDPPRPSTVVRDRVHARSLNGDLDNIILKAVRKEPENRYGSAEQFSEDLKAWMDGFPVSASKGTSRYRAKKFVRRHRVGVAVVSLFGFLLAGFSVAMGSLALRLARERERAAQVSAVLTNLFQGADPYRAKGAELTARELLDEGWRRVGPNLQSQPEVLSEVLGTMAQAYRHLGDDARAQQLYAAEVEARRKSSGPMSVEVARALRLLSDVERTRGDLGSAETHLRQALDIQNRALPPGAQELSHTLNDLGLVLQARGRIAEARDLFQRAIEISRLYPDQRTETLTMMSNLGGALTDLGDVDDAEKVLRGVLETRQAVLGKGHPQIPRSMNRLAYAMEMKGSYAEAEGLYRASAANFLQSLPPDHPDRLSSLASLAHLLQETHRYAEAESLYREAIESGKRKLGEHIDVAQWQSNLASLLHEEGKTAEAERLYEGSLAIYEKKLGPGSRREAQALLGRGRLYLDSGDEVKAGRDLDRALDIFRNTTGPDDPRVAETLFQLAMLRRKQRQLAEAQSLARQALEIDRKHAGMIDTSRHLLGLATILLDNHDAGGAEPLAKRALDMRLAILPPDAWQIGEARTEWNTIRKAEGLPNAAQ